MPQSPTQNVTPGSKVDDGLPPSILPFSLVSAYKAIPSQRLHLDSDGDYFLESLGPEEQGRLTSVA